MTKPQRPALPDIALPGRAVRAVVAATICGMMLLAYRRYYDPDEFEHLQASWLIFDGLLPYRDFFEHHTPVYHLLNAGLIALLTAGAVPPVGIVLALRAEAVLLAAGIFGLTHWLARLVSGRDVAALAVLLLASSSMFLTKGIEIRPDQLATLALLGAAIALVREGPETRPGPISLFGCGVLCALAVLTTQKTLFALPGLAVHVAARQPAGARATARAAPRALALVAAGGIAGSLPVLLYCLRNDMLAEFVRLNFLGNAMWPRNVWIAARLVLRAAMTDAVFVVLLVAGLAVIRRNWPREPPIRRLGVVVRPLSGMLIGLIVMPMAQEQYFFLFLPFAAIVAAWAAMRWLRAWPPSLTHPRAASVIAAAVPAMFIAGHVMAAWAMPDRDALDKLRYVTERTAANARVISGWSPGVAFRRPAIYYPFLHNELRYILSQTAVARILDVVRDPRSRPEIIDFDGDTRALPGLAALVEQAYAPTGVGTLWRRKP